MPNIASILKSEISRVARKEFRGETLGLKGAVNACRAAIAALRPARVKVVVASAMLLKAGYRYSSSVL